MQVSTRQFVAVVVLAIICGLCLSALIGGLTAGAINGPARWMDTVFRSSRPALYWIMTAAYAVGAAGSGLAAFVFMRRRAAA